MGESLTQRRRVRVLAFAFAFGAVAPVVLGMVKDSFSMSAGLSSLCVFFLLGAALIAVARCRFLERDYEG